jgi:hypothetical protein
MEYEPLEMQIGWVWHKNIGAASLLPAVVFDALEGYEEPTRDNPQAHVYPTREAAEAALVAARAKAGGGKAVGVPDSLRPGQTVPPLPTPYHVRLGVAETVLVCDAADRPVAEMMAQKHPDGERANAEFLCRAANTAGGGDAEARQMRRQLERILEATGQVTCKTDEECVGCGCRALSPEEAVVELRAKYDALLARANPSESDETDAGQK